LHYCRELLHSSDLTVSYFAAGVVAHLLADESTRLMLYATDGGQELRDELVFFTSFSETIPPCIPYFLAPIIFFWIHSPFNFFVAAQVG